MSTTDNSTLTEPIVDQSTPPEESTDEDEPKPQSSRWKRAFYITLIFFIAFLAYVFQNPDSRAAKFATDLKTQVDRQAERAAIRQGGGRTSTSNLGPRYVPDLFASQRSS